MPYWIESMLAATPALVWMFAGLGLPWALATLPRRDWSDRAAVSALALAFGPALLTAWMFVLGSVGSASRPLLRAEPILLGTGIIALAGWALVWRKARTAAPDLTSPVLPLAFDERLLLLLIAAALLIRWLGVAYWPFTAYDALWVYGYQGRLYTLLGHIPSSIGYYPQFLPLQYAYLQIISGGVINDHTARAVLPFLHLGSIVAAYLLGSRLFSRRAGVYAAALWALYPHVGAWSRFGDLEIPTTFLFTAAAAFFLQAWRGRPELPRRRCAIIAGLLLGVGMWTKPTMGAFIWGVLLLVIVAFGLALWQRRQMPPAVAAWRPRFWVAFWTGLACVPLGAVWYVRNIVLGHNAVDFPPAFWLTLAARSGAEFGWPLLALLAVSAWALWHSRRVRAHLALPRLLAGLALVLIGLLPSTFGGWRLGALELLALAAGAALVASALLPFARAQLNAAGADQLGLLLWAQLLALPYFVTWFISYSYHYRLSFPMVPLLLLPTALVAARWSQEVTGRLPRALYGLVLTALALPGVVIPLYDQNAGWDWLWTDKLPDDLARYQSGNDALMWVVDGLQKYEQENGHPPTVVAPGIVRLPFFFPLWNINTARAPTRLSELEDATYFIYGTPETSGKYEAAGLLPNQVVAALALAGYSDEKSILRWAWGRDDGDFNYSVYELYLNRRFVRPQVNVPPPEGEVIFGDFLRFLGHDIGGATFSPGTKIVLNLFWETLKPPPDDYMVYIHLRDAAGKAYEFWDGPVTRVRDGSYYTMLVWEPGEFVIDRRELLPQHSDTPPGPGYRIVIGLYSLKTNTRVPIFINGQPAGDGYALHEQITVASPSP